MAILKKKKPTRAEIVKAIRLAWDSLETHLDSSVATQEKKKCCSRSVGAPPFHADCVREYAYIINVLSGFL